MSLARRHASIAWLVGSLCACASARDGAREAPPPAPEAPPPALAAPERAAVEPWYEPEIRAFEQADREHPPAAGQVLFVGSSTIRMWDGLEADLGQPVLKRGFGGSKTREVLAVAERIVFPCRPATIVYYCGDNDLGTDNRDAAGTAQGFIEFAELARRRLPGVRILYLSIKPSIARWSNWPAMAEANALVQRYAEATEGVEFVDLAPTLLGPDGRPDPTLFLADGLHLDRAGYARWAEVVRARLQAAD